MTTTYDPKDSGYLDEADARSEMTRVFDVCQGCRQCAALCTAFPTLFDLLDRNADHDPGLLTPAEQDQVVDGCLQCKLCAVSCPYTPERHELNLDFPRLMLRAVAMQRTNRITSSRTKRATSLIGHTDLFGTIATSSAPVAPTMVGHVVHAAAGSRVRRVVAELGGVSSVRLLPPYAKQRFSTWFKKRPQPVPNEQQGSVTVFATCLVEYQATDIGKDLVEVYERNRVECAISAAGCCGAPVLHSGDVEEFTKIAEKNVATLAADIRRGTDIVVPQPTCSSILKHDYLDYVRAPDLQADARLLAANTYDAAEFLMRLHTGGSTSLDTEFDGETMASIVYHAPCHLRAQNIGHPSRDLMMLTGADVDMIEQCAGVGAMWGYRAGTDDISIPIAEQLGDRVNQQVNRQIDRHVDRASEMVVAGDCHLANTAIVEQTGRKARHPLQILARAYGIPEDN